HLVYSRMSMPLSGTTATARVSGTNDVPVLRRATVALMAAILLSGCGPKPKNQVNPFADTEMPRKIIWAWERPEDLRFLDPKLYGVAFLAQTITLEQDRVDVRKRRQPLEIADGTYVIAVTRIETVKEYGKQPTKTPEMADRIAELVMTTLDRRDVRGVQIDFDAVASERAFYRMIMKRLAESLIAKEKSDDAKHKEAIAAEDAKSEHPDHSYPASVRLTMTSLASWCTGDAWFNDFPVDEAVPMVFEMGADSDKIKRYLANGNDWTEPLCRASYGLSLEEGRFDGMKDGRRMYYFSNKPWKASDLEIIK
ncbi:MAG TPA: hypothetical protein PKA82_14170, partial [Pyrinomonadaceae bacterium]|nr:hypothetical protein [Pyrinomonadaceae bacterium]